MKKSNLIIILIAVVLAIGIAITGIYLINRDAQNNVEEIAAIEDLLEDINASNSDYITEMHSDFADNYDLITATPSAEDKSDAISKVDSALTEIDTPVDESGGFNVDFGTL